MVGDRGSVETVSGPAVRQIRLAVAAEPVQRSRKLSGQGDVRYRFVVRLVAFATQIPVNRINSHERGSTDVSRARHLAMYLLHTKLSLPFSEIARQFGRDRTTIAHACWRSRTCATSRSATISWPTWRPCSIWRCR